MEKRKGSTEIPNFVLVNEVETGEIGHSGNRVSGEGQSKGNIMHFNPRVEFPAFDGSNPRQWVKKCAKYFNLCKIPDDQKVDLASMHLQGKAEVWFSSYILGRKHVDWDDFIVDLCARFRGDMGRQVVEEFNKLHQGGGLDDYLEAFEELKALLLLKNPTLPNDYFVDSFIGGLKPSIKYFVRAFHPKTLLEAVEYAKSHEETLEAIKRNQVLPRTITSNSHKGLLLLPMSYQGPRVNGPSQTTQLKPKTLTPAERAEKLAKGLCFFCNQHYEKGH